MAVPDLIVGAVALEFIHSHYNSTILAICQVAQHSRLSLCFQYSNPTFHTLQKLSRSIRHTPGFHQILLNFTKLRLQGSNLCVLLLNICTKEHDLLHQEEEMVVLGGLKVALQVTAHHMRMATNTAKRTAHNHIGAIFKVRCTVLALHCSSTSIGAANQVFLAVTKMSCSGDEPKCAFLAAKLAHSPPIVTTMRHVHGQRSPVKRSTAVQRALDRLVGARPFVIPFHMRQDVAQFPYGSATGVNVRTLDSHLLDGPIAHFVRKGLEFALLAAMGAFQVAPAAVLLRPHSAEARQTHNLPATPQLLRFVRNLATHEAPIPGWVFKKVEIIRLVRIFDESAIFVVSHCY